MKVLITGGAGFIGSHIVDLLLKEQYQPIIVDNFSTGQKKFVPNGVKIYELDLESPQLEEVFIKERPKIVFHLAAQID
ncbi:MAG TPA: NAD-dependent epimerase/dehydratase family protein, partial [Bacilli bacterium]|nr:NAD-dependent epimerase/dehydratase family protein [Bacilli bacterium]